MVRLICIIKPRNCHLGNWLNLASVVRYARGEINILQHDRQYSESVGCHEVFFFFFRVPLNLWTDCLSLKQK